MDILFLRPSRFPSRTPLISRSASLSINSMISWVSLQSCSWKQRDIIYQYYKDYICSSLHLCIGTQLYWYKIEVKHCRNHAIHVIILFSECKCVHKITVKSLSCLKFDVHVLFAFHANTYLDGVFECDWPPTPDMCLNVSRHIPWQCVWSDSRRIPWQCVWVWAEHPAFRPGWGTSCWCCCRCPVTPSLGLCKACPSLLSYHPVPSISLEQQPG